MGGWVCRGEPDIGEGGGYGFGFGFGTREGNSGRKLGEGITQKGEDGATVVRAYTHVTLNCSFCDRLGGIYSRNLHVA